MKIYLIFLKFIVDNIFSFAIINERSDITSSNTCDCGGIGRHVRLRGAWETVRVQVPPIAPTAVENISTAVFL